MVIKAFGNKFLKIRLENIVDYLSLTRRNEFKCTQIVAVVVNLLSDFFRPVIAIFKNKSSFQYSSLVILISMHRGILSQNFLSAYQ